MIDQIKLIPLDPNNFSSENYSSTDEALLTSITELNTFNEDTDYVEFFVYDLNNSIVSPLGNDGTFLNYNILDNEIYVNPEGDLANVGVTNGIVNTLYNFFTKRLSSSPQSTYYISEISSDRTEIRLESNIISTEDIITSTTEFIAYREQDETFPDFYLNLGSNQLYIANNIRLDGESVLIKLYESLPLNINVKTSLWVVEKISNGLAYRVEFPNQVIALPNGIQLQGPNINLQQKGELNNSTENVNLTSFTSPNSQSEYQINSYFNDPSVNINVDYTDFGNFVNFSSAKSRIENFWYKVGLIESASEQIASQSLLTYSTFVSASLSPLNNIINDTITNFDRYEYYLYFESSSDTFPKTNSIPPYQNALTSSNAAETWYEDKLEEAENYDNQNQDWLYYTIPEYVRSDVNNNQYFIFTDMIGQFVDDNIWIYLKDTTNKWDADNRINAGVSKDLVAQVLRDMGVKLYQNNFSSTDLYSAFLGFTDSGSLFPFPYMTGSLPTPSGYEYISNFISSSDEAIPLDDINKRIYKRIYHNLPYLLKSKGTVAGLRTLINSYGIPDTILRISEFGGKDRNNVNDWDLWKHQFNYAVNFRETGHIKTKWHLNPNFRKDPSNPSPQSLQFRFNAGPYSGSDGIAAASQSLFTTSIGGNPNPAGCGIVLEYDQDLAAIPSSDTYSGSILDPEYQYANLKFTVDNFATSASIRLPFFNNDWWSVQVSKVDTEYTFYVGNKIYSGSDGSQIGFLESASFTTNNTGAWENNEDAHFGSVNGSGLTLSTGNYRNFQGKYQEIRYFRNGLSGSVFNDYVMNPQSTEGNNVNSSPNELAFRASLGGELYTGSVSIHPKVSGPTGYPTSSFASNSNFVIVEEEFVENREWVFYDSPAVGIKNRNTDKIKQQDLVLPSGNTLSNQKSIQQKSYTVDDYTNNLNLLEVAFSPQNQINDDIISQIGHFNIGDYIGDPRLVSSSANTYPSLVDLSKEYFEKYTSSYDVYDYIRLIKFFDNSLFKMVKDFVPSRTGLASGIVVKQHILERQKYPTPQAEWTRPEYTGSIGSTPALFSGSRYYEASTDYESIPIVTVEGGAGGSVNKFNRPTGYLNLTGGLNANPKPLEQTLFSLDAFTGVASVNFGDAYPETAITPSINDDGEFVNTNNITFKGEVMIGWINYIQNNQTITFRLYEDGKVVNTVSQYVDSPFGVATQWYVTMPNVEFKPNKTYKFTVTGTALMNGGYYTAKFYQLDPPLDYRSGQFYGVTNVTPLGNINEVIRDNHELYDGEFSGSVITVTDGELNTECNDIKKADTSNITFDIEFSSFNPNGTLKLPNVQLPFTGPPPSFTNTAQTLPSGDLNVYFTSTRVTTTPIPGEKRYTDTFKVSYIAISKTSKNGVDLTPSIPNATELTLLTSTLTPTIDQTYNSGFAFQSLTTSTSTLKFNVVSIKEYANSYLIEVTSDASIVLVSRKIGGAYVGDAEPYPVLVTTQNDTLSILNPYIEGNFANSDCNPLNNNATDITPSTVYYDVDYANNPNVAVNFGAIMSGSAPKAKIQDFNYHSNRSIIPRYSGSKNTSNDYNVLDGAIDATQAYFAYFNYVGGTAPEWGNGIADRSGINVRFFIDVNGNIIKPIADSQGINQRTVENNFTEGKIATVAFDDEAGASAAFANLLGNHTIFKSGKDITPIIYSQTASIAPGETGGYTSSLEFVENDAPSAALDYRLTANAGPPNYLQITGNGPLAFTNIAYQATQADIQTTGGVTWAYKPKLSPSVAGVTLNITATISNVFGPYATTNDIQLYKSTNGGTTFNPVGTLTSCNWNTAGTNTFSVSYSDPSANVGDLYQLQVTNFSGINVSLDNTSFFDVNQSPLPALGPAGPNFFTKSNRTLSLHPSFNSYYGLKQVDIKNTGFFGITNPFTIQVGDEIRFQGTEGQAYQVKEVYENTNPKSFLLDRYIAATNLDWFLVRRYVDNPANIIIEADKPAGGTSPGILKPQYLSRDAEDNIDTILESLRRDSLI